MAAEELIHLMTIMYMAIQEALDDPEGMDDVRQRLGTAPISLFLTTPG